MKKMLLILSLMALAITAAAVPAKRGVWRTLRLVDGTEVKAQLVGDEFGHFWKAADGTAYVEEISGEVFRKADANTIMQRAKVRRQRANANRAKRLPRRRVSQVPSSYTGVKKGLIVLVSFQDKDFKSTHNKALYQRIANEEGYSQGKFVGSMCDYFKAQSQGKFELDFDIVGPVKVSNKYSYYGKNDTNGDDVHPGIMVAEAVKLVDKEVDFSQYDWDGDGEVDQVYIVYAGYGESDTNMTNTIWPHAFTLTEAKEYNDGSGPVTVDGVKVDTYACGPELNAEGNVDGIGTMCHEFSHCLGFPDFYDTSYSGGQGMCSWDLMDSGSYNGDGYCPAGYTSYERWMAGWLEPTVLEEKDTVVTGMKALQEGGESFIIYNKGNRNEYYLLENRQLIDWDAGLPGSGLLILHVDYDAQAWEDNMPNNNKKHQRMTWVAADNKYQYEMDMGSKYFTDEGMKNDPFPYDTNDCFNKSTQPAASFFNNNSDGTKYMDSSVENIKLDAKGNVSFNFVSAEGGGQGGEEKPYEKPTIEDAIFYESFNNCKGKGGNDDIWGGQVASATLTTDNSGWTTLEDKGYGGHSCARFGSSTVNGSATTPGISLEGSAKLSFRAGAWDSKNDQTTLNLKADGATITPNVVTLEKGKFNDYEVTIVSTPSATGTSLVYITFESLKGRFFLDEVIVKLVDNTTTGIVSLDNSTISNMDNCYDLSGRKLSNTKWSNGQMKKGFYIVNGRKVVLR